MTYEFETGTNFGTILNKLTDIGVEISDNMDIDPETYGYDTGRSTSWICPGSNMDSFDSMSTFDGDDYEYMQNILY